MEILQDPADGGQRHSVSRITLQLRLDRRRAWLTLFRLALISSCIDPGKAFGSDQKEDIPWMIRYFIAEVRRYEDEGLKLTDLAKR